MILNEKLRYNYNSNTLSGFAAANFVRIQSCGLNVCSTTCGCLGRWWCFERQRAALEASNTLHILRRLCLNSVACASTLNNTHTNRFEALPAVPLIETDDTCKRDSGSAAQQKT